MTTQERADFGSSRSLPGLTPASPATPFAKPGTGLSPVCLLAQKFEQPVDSDSLPGFARVAMPRPAPVANEVGLTLTLPNGITLSGLHLGNIDLLGAIMRQL